MRVARLLVPVSALVLTAGLVGPAMAKPRPSVQSGPAWAPAATAKVHPGVQTFTPQGQCTANFVFTDGANVYIGQSAHCSGTGAANETNGCDAKSLPEGTEVRVTGASKPGVMVYNSWIRMQAAGEKDASTCDYNDFALVRLDPADVAVTNPSVPVFGGPVALRSTGTRLGEKVASYGNSGLRFGLSPFSPKHGRSLGTDGGGWSHTVYTASPGVPGDSGSAFLDGSGNAIGTLSTVALAPFPASNGVSDLSREIAYAQAHGFPQLALALGTEPFTGSL